MPQVNLRVGEKQKERWEAYLDKSSEVQSLSDLIRLSVEKEIKGEHQPEVNIDLEGIRDVLEEQTEDIVTQVSDEVRQSEGAISREIRKLQTEETDEEEITEIAAVLAEIVKQVSSEIDIPAAIEGDVPDKLIEAATVENYAEKLRERGYEVDEYTVRTALEKLTDEMARVEEIQTDNGYNIIVQRNDWA